MVFKQWGLEVRYPAVDDTYFYLKMRERKMRNYAGTFLSFSPSLAGGGELAPKQFFLFLVSPLCVVCVAQITAPTAPPPS
jgi:hypothetical protein